MEAQTTEQAAQSPSRLNRYRRHPRVRIAAPFACALSPLHTRRWLRKPLVDLGVVYDLSVRGARVSTEAAIRPGDEVALVLRLPKQIQTAEIAVARVRWAKDRFFGIAFTRLSTSSYSRLKKYVAIVSAASAA